MLELWLDGDSSQAERISDVITSIHHYESAQPACKQRVVDCLTQVFHMVHCAANILARFMWRRQLIGRITTKRVMRPED